MDGTCGTCGRDAIATPENEGYSDCCNDRIEYDEEAEQTKRRVALEKKELDEHQSRMEIRYRTQ